MDELVFLNINGNLLPAKDSVIKGNNRSFLYGDGIFESMHAYASEIQFVENHFNRVLSSAEKLHFEIPNDFNVNVLKRETERLLHKNRFFKGVRIRLNIFRDEGGLYTPEKNTISWLLQGAKLETDKYTLNKKGFSIEVFDEIRKSVNILSNIKSSNALLYVLGGIYKNTREVDDVLIINESGNIIEALSSNIFILIDGKVITPGLESGPVAGVMRQIVINILDLIGYHVVYEEITEDLLMNADELFFTNAVKGVQWAAGYKSKRYFNSLSNKVLYELNRVAFTH